MNRFPRLARAIQETLEGVAVQQNEMRKIAEVVVIDQVSIECMRCGDVRVFDHDPPLRGGEGLRDFMHAVPKCRCGSAEAEVKCRLVEELAESVCEA